MLREKDILMRELQTAMRILARLLKLPETEIPTQEFSTEENEILTLDKVASLLKSKEITSRQFEYVKALLQILLMQNKAKLRVEQITQNDYKHFKTEWLLLANDLETKSGVYDFELNEMKNQI